MFCFTCFANVLPFKIFISSSSKSPSLLFALTCDYCTCLSFFASQSCSLLQMEVHCPLRTSLKRCWGTEWEGGVDAYELRSASLPLWKPVFRGRFLDFSFSMDPFHPGLLGSLWGAVIQCLSISACPGGLSKRSWLKSSPALCNPLLSHQGLEFLPKAQPHPHSLQQTS